MQYLGFRITCDDEPVSDEREGALVAGTVGLRNAWKQAPGQFCADWDDKLAILLSKGSGQVWSPVLAGIRYRVELAAIDPADIGIEPEPQRLISGGLVNYQVLAEDSQHVPMRISASNDWLVPAADLIGKYATRATAKGPALVFEGLPFERFRTIADDPRVGSVTEGAPTAQALALASGIVEVDGIIHRERGLIPTACVINVPRTAAGTEKLQCMKCGAKFEQESTPTYSYPCPECGSFNVDALRRDFYDHWDSDDLNSKGFAAMDFPVVPYQKDSKHHTADDVGADEVSASLLSVLLGGNVAIPMVDRVASSTYLVSWLNDVELAGRYDRG